MARIPSRPPLESEEGKDLFKVSEVARLFGVTVQAVHSWIKSGRIRRKIRTSTRGNYLVPRLELIRMLRDAKREVPGLWQEKRINVLLIDDDPHVREFARLAAGSPALPMRLEVSANLEDGLVLAARCLPDVILLDCFFPKDRLQAEQAISFVRHAKAMRTVRIVAMVDHPKLGIRMQKEGADAVLLKPFDLREFRTVLYVQWKSGLERVARPVVAAEMEDSGC